MRLISRRTCLQYNILSKFPAQSGGGGTRTSGGSRTLSQFRSVISTSQNQSANSPCDHVNGDGPDAGL